MRADRLWLLIPILLAFFGSCEKKRDGLETLSFEASSVISAQNRIALVIDPYISLRDKSGPDGITIAHGRRGEIYGITGVELVEAEKGLETWYNLGNGWVSSSSIRVFSDRSKAQSAASELY